MLSYCSLEYLVVFLPAVLILYQILPKKARRYWLLAASYLFFWYLSGLLVLWNVALAVIIYLTGRRLEGVIGKRDLQLKQAQRDQKKQIRARCEREKRLWMILAAVAGFGILVTLKYSAFFAENLNALASHVPRRRAAADPGISRSHRNILLYAAGDVLCF